MAKLSARGRKEIFRVSKEVNLSETDSDLISWSRTTIALMSDGVILKKRDVAFRATPNSAAYKHSYGWSQLAKTKKDPKEIRAYYTTNGYK